MVRRTNSGRIEGRLFDDSSSSLDRFGALLVLTITSVAALSLIDLDAFDHRLARGLTAFALALLTGVTLVLGLRAAGVTARLRRIAEIAVVLAALVSVGALIAELTVDVDLAGFHSDRPSVMWVAIAIVTPVAVVRRLLHHRSVSGQTLAGAVAAYLLIALASCYLFFLIDDIVDGGFFGDRSVPSHEFMYFSLVTITTLGYGDLSPDERVGQLAATSEAVIGQVYLVTIVAMVVGTFIQQRSDR